MTRTLFAALVLALLNGCADPDEPRPPKKVVRAPAPMGVGKKVNVGKNVWLEILPGNKRRVIVSAEVCLDKGPLELLLTRKGTKEHEAILAADVDARHIHTALETAGARLGRPAEFVPRFQAATGGQVAIEVQYTDKDGKEHQVRANAWLRNMATGQELETDWVFGGSHLDKDPGDPQAPLRELANGTSSVAVSKLAMLTTSPAFAR